jgi:ribonuclease HI
MSKEELRREADRLIAASGGLTAVKARAPAWQPRKVVKIVPPPAKHNRSGPRPDSGGRQRYADIAVPAGLVVYADGCCEPNPGPGGWAFAVYRDGDEVYSECGGDEDATNNTMEMTAALKALRWICRNVREPARLLTDSMYVVNGCNDWRHGWKRKGWKRGPEKPLANVNLWQALDAVLIALPIKLEWVKGHVGIIGNERADELSLIGRQTVLDQSPTSLDLIRQQLDYSARA